MTKTCNARSCRTSRIWGINQSLETSLYYSAIRRKKA